MKKVDKDGCVAKNSPRLMEAGNIVTGMRTVRIVRVIVISLWAALLALPAHGADEVCGGYLTGKDPVATIKKLKADPSAVAQFCVAAFYFQGIGVKRDAAEALAWLKRSADQGYPNAQTNLGVLFMTGDGVKPDKAEAARLFIKAAQKQYPWAEYYLGGVYYEGEGAEKNDIEAVKWFKKATDHGLADAQEALKKLGESYQNNNGAGDYEAMMVLFDKDGKTYPAASEKAEKRSLSVQADDDVYVMLFARGCRTDKDGKCVETVKIGIFDPAWCLDNEFQTLPFHAIPDVHIWPDGPGAQAVSFKLKIAPRDAAGLWHVFAVIYDGATPKLNLDQIYRVQEHR